MEFIIAESTEDMSRQAADRIASFVTADPSCVLGLATGTTPIGLYACLVDDCAQGKLSFADVTTFNLDEYRGLAPEHDQSYRYFMKQHLFDHVDIDQARTHVPEGSNPDAEAVCAAIRATLSELFGPAVCAAYEQAIEEAGGVDLQLLGLGPNGHIGFNEPEDTFPKTTHCVDLTESTIQANSRLFDSVDEVPRQAYTMGIGTIMAARSVLVVVEGSHKAEIVKQAFFGPVTPEVPASILQFHPNATVIVDPAAGALCK